MKDFYYYGIYFAEEDPPKARKYCSVAIDMIGEIMVNESEKDRCKKFLSAHYIELIDLFKNSENSTIFEKLVELDPDHAEAYRDHLGPR